MLKEPTRISSNNNLLSQIPMVIMVERIIISRINNTAKINMEEICILPEHNNNNNNNNSKISRNGSSHSGSKTISGSFLFKMYKASQSAVSRTVLPSIQQKSRTSNNNNTGYSKVWRTAEESVLATQAKKDKPLFESDIPMSLFSKKKNRNGCSLTPPSTPSSPLVEEQIEFLHNSWKAFKETPSGEVDTEIVEFHADCKSVDEDFEPFDVDRYLAEKLLKELDIDPKLALF